MLNTSFAERNQLAGRTCLQTETEVGSGHVRAETYRAHDSHRGIDRDNHLANRNLVGPEEGMRIPEPHDVDRLWHQTAGTPCSYVAV